jgi:hypothetical protein
MTISIPFGRAPADAPTAAGLHVNVPVRFGGGSPLADVPLGSVASAQVLAVTAAACVDDPTDALLLARLAQAQPELALVRNFDPAKIVTILAAVRAAQDDPNATLDAPSPEQTAAATAVGAAPRLVVAATNAIKAIDAKTAATKLDPTTTAGWSARRWAIDLLDLSVLDRAGRAVLRAAALQPLDSGQDPGAGALADRVTKIEKLLAENLVPAVATLRTDVDGLMGKTSTAKR